MDSTDVIRIPLRNRAGEVIAHTVIDASDAALAELRWHLNAYGYAVRFPPRQKGVPKRPLYLHRVLLGLSPGDGLLADHINRDRLDNRRENLRACTLQENGQNVTPREGTSSTYRGVFGVPSGRWSASSEMAGRTYRHGTFDSEKEAAAAAAAFRAQHMPFSTD